MIFSFVVKGFFVYLSLFTVHAFAVFDSQFTVQGLRIHPSNGLRS